MPKIIRNKQNSLIFTNRVRFSNKRKLFAKIQKFKINFKLKSLQIYSKIHIFLKHALKLNADFIATGHYAIKQKKNNTHILLEGLDKTKDQSYFLCQLNHNQLKKIIFPIGDLPKKEVRTIAKKLKLATADRKLSPLLFGEGKLV